jgi:hypothetical protein
MGAVVVCFNEARGIIGVCVKGVEMSADMLHRSKLLPSNELKFFNSL